MDIAAVKALKRRYSTAMVPQYSGIDPSNTQWEVVQARRMAGRNIGPCNDPVLIAKRGGNYFALSGLGSREGRINDGLKPIALLFRPAGATPLIGQQT